MVEGLVGPQGTHGTLSNSGFSYYRDRRGKRRTRVQKPETMVLSRYDLRADGLLFTIEEESVLEVFENSGVATGWVLEFAPASNDIDLGAITNVHMVFYLDAYYSPRVNEIVRAELAAAARYDYSLGLGIRFQYPDEFFTLQSTGMVQIALDQEALPFDHTDPRIRGLYILLEPAAGASTSGLVVEVKLPSGATITQTTDSRGMLTTDSPGAPLAAARGQALLGDWQIGIDQTINAAGFAAGFKWEQVRNIYLFAEYRYTPRGRSIIATDLATDPMALFDVADDPAATSGGPSQWVYDAAAKKINQLSNIHAPAGTANLNTSPDKPGTYLVHKTAPSWPALKDLVMRTRINSTDDDGIGVVFRFQDHDNFYFFLMDSQRKYRRLGKKVGGVFTELASVAIDTALGFDVNREYRLTVAAVGEALHVRLDDSPILSGLDQSIAVAGRVGIYSWGNTGVQVADLSIQPV